MAAVLGPCQSFREGDFLSKFVLRTLQYHLLNFIKHTVSYLVWKSLRPLNALKLLLYCIFLNHVKDREGDLFQKHFCYAYKYQQRGTKLHIMFILGLWIPLEGLTDFQTVTIRHALLDIVL